MENAFNISLNDTVHLNNITLTLEILLENLVLENFEVNAQMKQKTGNYNYTVVIKITMFLMYLCVEVTAGAHGAGAAAACAHLQTINGN